MWKWLALLKQPWGIPEIEQKLAKTELKIPTGRRLQLAIYKTWRSLHHQTHFHLTVAREEDLTRESSALTIEPRHLLIIQLTMLGVYDTFSSTLISTITQTGRLRLKKQNCFIIYVILLNFPASLRELTQAMFCAVKPWSNGPASSRKWTQFELA